MRDLWLLEVTLITASSSLIRINQNLGPQLEKTAGLNSLIPEKRIKSCQDQKSLFGMWCITVLFLTSPYLSNNTTCSSYFSYGDVPTVMLEKLLRRGSHSIARWNWRKSDSPQCCKKNEKVPPPSKQHEGLSLHHDYLLTPGLRLLGWYLYMCIFLYVCM